MTRAHAQARELDPQGGYVVQRARENDALGGSLRNAFSDDGRTPFEMVRLLEQIDRLR